MAGNPMNTIMAIYYRDLFVYRVSRRKFRKINKFIIRVPTYKVPYEDPEERRVFTLHHVDRRNNPKENFR